LGARDLPNGETRGISWGVATKGCIIPWSGTGNGGEEAIINPGVLERVPITVRIFRDNPLRVNQRDVPAGKHSCLTFWLAWLDTKPVTNDKWKEVSGCE
jgi:hypothetical protein